MLYYFRYAPLSNDTKDLFFSVYNRICISVVNSFEHYEEWHRELCPLERRNGGKQKVLIMKIHGNLSSHIAAQILFNTYEKAIYLHSPTMQPSLDYFLITFLMDSTVHDEKLAPETRFKYFHC